MSELKNLNPFVVAYADRSAASVLEAIRAPYALADSTEAIIAIAKRRFPVAILLEVRGDNQWHSILQQLRDNPVCQHVPIVAATVPELRSLALETGANELVGLPLEAAELRIRLASLQKTDLTGSLDALTHDLNNPISISSYSLQVAQEILAEENVSVEINELIANVLLANRRLQFLVDDTVDFFRLKAGHYERIREPVDLAIVVGDVTEDILDLAAPNNIRIQAQLPKALPRPIGDARLVRRVLNAALDTAIKFCQPNRVIRVEASADLGGVTIAVTDPGRPIPPDYEPARLFDPAYTTEARDSGSRSAVALSLPFCQAAMRSMNGTAYLVSNRAEGLTTLCLWLPLATET